MSLLINNKDLNIHRRGFGLAKVIGESLTGDYRSGLIDWLQHNNYRLDLPGVTIKLAKEFGFCYGVDRAIDYAYETREQFPERRIFLTTEIIHNPRVNKRMIEMGIEFLDGQYAVGKSYDDIQPEDVVILPAFGVSTQELERLHQTGCVLVDTTCGSVMNVWKKVARYERESYTSVIHGKYYHEETIATASYASSHGGHYVVVFDKNQAEKVCEYIRGEGNRDEFLKEFAKAVSPGFDPDLHLEKVGVANQTTMLSSESLEIADMLRQAFADRYGESKAGDRFESFDTICSATQERQDAIVDMVATKNPPDLVLVIGGFNSSNTGHLLEICTHYTMAYHIDDAACIASTEAIRHKPFGEEPLKFSGSWIPEKRPLTVGFTGGASTPNRVIGDAMLSLLENLQISEEAVAAALEAGNPVPEGDAKSRK
jgi:4-hydroxy-3-methylbut-2-enyl diphosphate reductase